MEKMIGIKKLEVLGATKEEALAKAPFFIQGDATQAYRNWEKTMVNGITEADIKQFMIDYLAKKSKNAPGIGYSITKVAAVADTRERPYKITPIKNEEGPRKTGKVFQLIDAETNKVLAETTVKMVPQTDKEGTELKDKDGNVRMKVSSQTLAEAKELARKLIVEGGFKGKGYCRLTKQVVEGQDRVFDFEYTPSKSSRVGTYIVFGVEAF